jgi:hypothetical protein
LKSQQAEPAAFAARPAALRVGRLERAGKTTTVEILEGYRSPDEGETGGHPPA